jgi:hypothetical protein
VHNTAHLPGYVMDEYLEESTKESLSNFPWNQLEMGFLATVWGKRKYMPCSKKEATMQVFDGRNMKKGEKSFDSTCQLCNMGEESQAYLMLRCKHPVMKFWRDDYFQRCHLAKNECLKERPKAFMGSLWKWIVAPLELEEGVESGKNSQIVAVMLGRPIKEDLKNQQYDREINSGERAAMLFLNKQTW